MKFFRLIILILLSLSVPLLGLAIWIFFGVVEIFPEWKKLAIISSIFAGIIFIFSWFLLNKKAKIVGGIFGGILTIIVFLILFFWNFWKENPENLNENFSKNSENLTIVKSGNIFDNIFPLGESILEFDKSEEKIPKILSAEKCEEVKNVFKFLDDESANILKRIKKLAK